jgi:hypothetical protein
MRSRSRAIFQSRWRNKQFAHVAERHITLKFIAYADRLAIAHFNHTGALCLLLAIFHSRGCEFSVPPGATGSGFRCSVELQLHAVQGETGARSYALKYFTRFFGRWLFEICIPPY